MNAFQKIMSFFYYEHTVAKVPNPTPSPPMEVDLTVVSMTNSMRADGKVGGHFVTGHVEGTAKVTKWSRAGQDWELEAEVPAGMERYVVPKGCVALDGISLTIGRVEGRRFNVWIIPHTHEVTTLKDRKEGDELNLECDLLAKYVEKVNRESR
jgi:riboflavin synthase